LRLCDSFNAETGNGLNMERYEELLAAVVAHVAAAHSTTQAAGLGIGAGREFVLPRASEAPQDPTDVDLFNWLVISKPKSHPSGLAKAHRRPSTTPAGTESSMDASTREP